jgi:hypothetical protein
LGGGDQEVCGLRPVWTKNVHETPSQSIKTGCGGSCLSSQLWGPDWPGHKVRPCLRNN